MIIKEFINNIDRSNLIELDIQKAIGLLEQIYTLYKQNSNQNYIEILIVFSKLVDKFYIPV